MIPLKQFVFNEAERRGVKPHTIYDALHRGRYPNLRLKKNNRRVIFVLNRKLNFVVKLIPTTRKPIAIFV